MQREEEILKYVDVGDHGIEIAPFFRPLLPKTRCQNVLTLDVLDAEALREQGKNDPNVRDFVANIEEVDLVCDACDIEAAVYDNEHFGNFQHIVSSHNFEHLPNPIKFLIGCSNVLRPGGILGMAIPDFRACFDHFRFPTRLSDWLLAYQSGSERPSPETIFDSRSNTSSYVVEGVGQVGCNFATDSPDNFKLIGNLADAYSAYLDRKQGSSQDYTDAHCSVVTNRTFELLISDLVRIGLLNLEIVEISDVNGLEFYAHLRKPEADGDRSNDRMILSEVTREDQLRAASRSLGSFGSSHLSVHALQEELRVALRERDRIASELRHLARYPWKNMNRFIRRK